HVGIREPALGNKTNIFRHIGGGRAAALAIHHLVVIVRIRRVRTSHKLLESYRNPRLLLIGRTDSGFKTQLHYLLWVKNAIRNHLKVDAGSSPTKGGAGMTGMGQTGTLAATTVARLP